MNDKKLKQLFDFQKFEKNASLGFAIQSAQNYINSLKNQGFMELDESELDFVNAAGPVSGNVRGMVSDKQLL